MQQSEKIDQVLAAISGAMAEIAPVKKTGVNSFQKYTYASDFDITQAIRPACVKHGIVIALVGMEPIEEKRAQVDRYKFTWRIGHKSGQYFELTDTAQGQDKGDKAAYKAITGAKKYIYTTTFMLATSDDPEVHTPDIADTPQPAPQAKAHSKKQAARTAKAEPEKSKARLVPRDEVKRELLRIADGQQKFLPPLAKYFWPKVKPNADYYPDRGFQNARGTEPHQLSEILAALDD